MAKFEYGDEVVIVSDPYWNRDLTYDASNFVWGIGDKATIDYPEPDYDGDVMVLFQNGGKEYINQNCIALAENVVVSKAIDDFVSDPQLLDIAVAMYSGHNLTADEFRRALSALLKDK